MVASEFSTVIVSWMLVLVYGAAYAFYNSIISTFFMHRSLDTGNVQRTCSSACCMPPLLARSSRAFLLTWATAYRPPAARQCVAFSTAGPFRYVATRNTSPIFLLILVLARFKAALDFRNAPRRSALLLRLVAREELLLDLEYGDSFRAYAQRVPAPSLSSRRIADDGNATAMVRALWDQAFQWASSPPS